MQCIPSRWGEVSGKHIDLQVGDICDWEFLSQVRLVCTTLLPLVVIQLKSLRLNYLRLGVPQPGAVITCNLYYAIPFPSQPAPEPSATGSASQPGVYGSYGSGLLLFPSSVCGSVLLRFPSQSAPGPSATGSSPARCGDSDAARFVCCYPFIRSLRLNHLRLRVPSQARRFCGVLYFSTAV